MPDNDDTVWTMDNEPTVLDAVKRTRDILRARGWTRKWSNGDGGPVNIRCTLSAACNSLAGESVSARWYELYIGAAHAISGYLKKGIVDWEATVTDPTKPLAMLSEVVQRMEKGELNTGRPTGSDVPASRVGGSQGV